MLYRQADEGDGPAQAPRGEVMKAGWGGGDVVRGPVTPQRGSIRYNSPQARSTTGRPPFPLHTSAPAGSPTWERLMSNSTSRTSSGNPWGLRIALGVLLLVAAAVGSVIWYRQAPGPAQGQEGAAILMLRIASGAYQSYPESRPVVLDGYWAQVHVKNASGEWQAEGGPTRDLTAARDRKVRIYAWPDRSDGTGLRALLSDPDAGIMYSTYPDHPRCNGVVYEGPEMPPAVDAAYREGRDRPGSRPDRGELPAGVPYDKRATWDHAVPTRDGNVWLPVGG